MLTSATSVEHRDPLVGLLGRRRCAAAAGRRRTSAARGRAPGCGRRSDAGVVGRSCQAARKSAIAAETPLSPGSPMPASTRVSTVCAGVEVGLLAVLARGRARRGSGSAMRGQAADADAVAGALVAAPHRRAAPGRPRPRHDPAAGVALGRDVGDVAARDVHRDAVVAQRAQRGVDGAEGAGHVRGSGPRGGARTGRRRRCRRRRSRRRSRPATSKVSRAERWPAVIRSRLESASAVMSR